MVAGSTTLENQFVEVATILWPVLGKLTAGMQGKCSSLPANRVGDLPCEGGKIKVSLIVLL